MIDTTKNALRRWPVLLLLCIALGGVSAFADTPVPGERLLRYVMVLKDGAAEPNVAQAGGREVSRWHSRRLIEVPRSALEGLSRHPAVAWLALVHDGTETDAPSYVRGPEEAVARRMQTNTEPEFRWESGLYQYDHSGNVIAIGNDTFRYDKAQRLVKAVARGETIEYTYDSFGNQVRRTIGSAVVPSTADPRSNHLDHTEYDRAGNQLTAMTDAEGYVYDAANMMVQRGALAPRRYVYTADDERIGIATGSDENEWKWTVRDFSHRVLATYEAVGKSELTTWEWHESHHYRGSQLASGVKVEERARGAGHARYFHVDHLGSPRLISNQNRQKIAAHDYHPFGKEQTKLNQEFTDWQHRSVEPMKFTGHERDFTTSFDANVHDYLDYMHARHYTPALGRFLSVDPVMDVKRHLREPQGWNRYSYVMNNPVKSVDPDGRETFVVIVAPAGVDNPKGFAGHTALFVTSQDGRQAGVSYGGAHDFKRAGILGLINDYNGEGRSVTVYKLKTTDAQDAKMVDFLKQNPDGGVNPDAGRMARAMVTENCTTAACNTLKAGGVVGRNEDPNGALSGAHTPNELKQALEPGGDLSNRVQQKWVFEPEKKERKE